MFTLLVGELTPQGADERRGRGGLEEARHVLDGEDVDVGGDQRACGKFATCTLGSVLAVSCSSTCISYARRSSSTSFVQWTFTLM